MGSVLSCVACVLVGRKVKHGAFYALLSDSDLPMESNQWSVHEVMKVCDKATTWHKFRDKVKSEGHVQQLRFYVCGFLEVAS